MSNEEMIENLKCVIADISVQCEHLKAENAELKSSLTHANEECLKWHERAQNLLKYSGGSISGYEKKISDLQSENAALRERLEKIVEPPCKIGDILYTVTTVFSDVWVGDTILHRNGFSISETEVTEKNIWNMCDLIRRGMAFFSKEAAEARLRELQGGKE